MADDILTIAALTKRFGDFTAVDDISLGVPPGEMLALLGPSGCGKTTTLRMISGLERPSAGEISFDGRSFVSVDRAIYLAPEKRNVGMVFQSYALWPHMTVADNVGYPLKLRRVGRAERRRRVLDSLDLMGLANLADQTIPRLSGGQQQRVALARALVYEPSLMLFDEPFSILVAQLRAQMRLELKALRRKVRMTGVFVTHDQVEALSLADRVAIMRDGRIEQLGTPTEVYRRPATRFVRDFLGKVVNLHGVVQGRAASGTLAVRLDGAGERTVLANGGATGLDAGTRVEVSIRPEHVRINPGDGDGETNTLSGVIDDLLFTGSSFETRIHVGDATILLELPPDQGWREGDTLTLALDTAAISLWPDEG